MGKIGIVGQLGLMLIAPYAMPMLGSLATSMMGTSLGGIGGAIVKGAGQFLNAAVKVGTRVGQAFKSVSEAVTGTVKNVVGATLEKAGLGNVVKGISGWDVSGMNFKDAFAKSGELWSNAGDSLSQVFSKSTFDTSMNKFGIEKSLAEGIERTGALEYKPDQVSSTVQGVDLETMQLSTDAVGVGIDGSYENMITNYKAPSLLEPPVSSGTILETSMQSVGKNYKANSFLPGEWELARGTHTVAEATAWEKAKGVAAKAGIPTTLTGVAEYMAAKDVEYDWPTTKGVDMVDYGALQTSPIYPASGGLQYANMLQPEYSAPSLVDAIANGDYQSLYTNSKGQGGFYYGFPALAATMAQNAQEMLYEYE